MKAKKGKTGPPGKKQPDKANQDSVIPQSAVGEDSEAQSIDKIREILFGAQAEQYEQKLVHLEALLQKEIAGLRDETKETFNSLQDYIKKEIESLADQLKRGKDERAKNMKELSGKLEGTNKNIEKRFTKLDEKTLKIQRDLQEQILQQSKELMAEIRVKHEEASASLEQSVSELGQDKADRVALANLFMEVSMRLKEEFDIPEIE